MTYTKDHINWIDRLKGIAILLVVMGHVYCKCLKNEDALGFFLIQGFHMPLFMFLSGIVIKGYPSFKKCIVKSIQFLSPALIVGCVLCVITNRTMIGMLTSGSKYGYWYLYVLVIFYWLLFVYGRIGRKWSGGGGFNCIINTDLFTAKNTVSLFIKKYY